MSRLGLELVEDNFLTREHLMMFQVPGDLSQPVQSQPEAERILANDVQYPMEQIENWVGMLERVDQFL